MITGPSGAGKGTLIPLLRERVPELETTISATTRERRPGEVDGRDYHFLAEQDFLERVERDEFLEWITYVSGQRYGTLASELDRIREQGGVPLLELETKGAQNVKRVVPGAVTIFISAPVAELERRLRERATESAGEIDERIALARRQLAEARDFDHVVENDEVGRAVDALEAVVRRVLDGAATMRS